MSRLLPPHWLDLIFKKNQGDTIFTFLPKKILYSSATFLQMIFILENLDQMVRLSNAEFQYSKFFTLTS